MVVYRVLLNGRWVASYSRRDLAERAIAGWLREWDGEFTIQERRAKP